MSRRETAQDRVLRILTIFPWIAERDGPTIAEVCEQFSLTVAQLQDDIETIMMSGLPPYTPDTLNDVVIDDDRVWVSLGDYFSRPLNLTAAEAFSLLVAADAAALRFPPEERMHLDSGIAKVASALDIRRGEGGDVDVHLGEVDDAVRAEIERAQRGRRQVEIDYYTLSRDALSLRVVDPIDVRFTEGQWYLQAWCHTSQAERTFRIDRIRKVTVLDVPVLDHSRESRVRFTAPTDGFVATLHLDPSSGWFASHYPVRSHVEREDGTHLVEISVGDLMWLARVLLPLGRSAQVESISGPDGSDEPEALRRFHDIAQTLVSSILARYESDSSESSPA